jgi:hypothetical protein
MDLDFAPPDVPCLFCERTPGSGAWDKPCPTAPDHLHYTREQFSGLAQDRLNNVGASLRRAAYELELAAKAVEALPERLRRKVVRDQLHLDPDLLRNEAGRARDALHVYRLLDV